MLNWRDPCNPLTGGAERVTEAYLRALLARGHEVAWFANAFEGASKEEDLNGLQVVRAGGKFTSWLAARRWVRQQQPFDLIIDQHHGIPWYAPWWAKTRVVAYIHEVLGPIWSSFYPWPISALGRWQERQTLRRYRRTPFWSGCQFTCDQLRALGVESVTPVSYGVDIEALAELDDKLLTQPLRLIVVSRLAPNKRVDHAICAVRRLREQGVEVSLRIVGDGQERAALGRLVDELKLQREIEFSGRLAEVQKDAALREAHLLLHTSVREGWGLNVAEANAMGTPAVVYPVPGLEESTLHGKTGLVSEEESPESLAAAVRTALQQPEDYQKLRIAARDRARSLHWENVLPGACDQLEAWAGAIPCD
ncbi:MAG: glycosyltransferase family 4 protein [Verrucomicrobiota bacterium]|jgi:glycosyltransferase involved in cell wall biosynthesis|nr:glycosyltransferase family 4 protein [Verrucomicrobiota bacterium]